MGEKYTHWKKLTNPDYLGSWAFEPGQEMTVTIASVGVERVTGADGKQEDCTVAHFAEDVKPMILNTTNQKMISKVVGSPYIEDWAGRRIVLGVETVSAFGDRVEAVRVRKKQAVAVATDCADCGQAIQAAGKFTAAQIASAAQKRFGRALCLECAEQAKEAANASD